MDRSTTPTTSRQVGVSSRTDEEWGTRPHAARRTPDRVRTRRAALSAYDNPANRKANKVGLEALREALDLADALGSPRKEWAPRLGYTVGAVGEWFRRGRCPCLVELVLRADVLPGAARELLLQRLVDKAGMVVSKRPQGCGRGSMEAQLVAMTGKLGTIAEQVQASVAPGSDGGRSVTPVERGRMIETTTQLLKQAAGMLSVLESGK